MSMNIRTAKLALAATIVVAFSGSDWTHFRGSDSRSVSNETGLPTKFDAAKTMSSLPGRGPSSPIIVGDKLIVTASGGAKRDRLHVLCYDKTSGESLWQRRLWATGHTIVHPFGCVAAATPASDGKHIVAFFSSNDLACFDLDGNLRWFRGLANDWPTARNDVGMASSPLIVGDVVVVQIDNQGESFAAGIDMADGRTRWRIARQKEAMWTSPVRLPAETPEKDLVLLQSRKKLTSHDPRTGKQVWQFEASCHSVATLTTDEQGCVYLPAEGLNKLKYDADSGQVELLWHQPKLRSANSSPIVHGGKAYTIKKPGILVCGDADDGEILWQLRLQGPFWATPVLADGKLYCVNHKGLVQVVELGEQGKLLETSQLADGMLASPAVSDGAIYFRNDGSLWGFGK